jgi:hypothetical protein
MAYIFDTDAGRSYGTALVPSMSTIVETVVFVDTLH